MLPPRWRPPRRLGPRTGGGGLWLWRRWAGCRRRAAPGEWVPWGRSPSVGVSPSLEGESGGLAPAARALREPALLSYRAASGLRLLQPYPPGQHGPRHGHRHVRDCQPVRHGNVTHETWPGDNSTGLPAATTRTFVSYISSAEEQRRAVYGHFTFVRNPLRTLSVLEPGGAGGCGERRRVTVEETARLGRCLVAQNGGYFDMSSGECLGNVVSDGRLVQNARGLQNAQFGIRRDGSMVFG